MSLAFIQSFHPSIPSTQHHRQASVPPQYKERIKEAFAKVRTLFLLTPNLPFPQTTHSLTPPGANPLHQANVDYGKFKAVDNTCSDQIQSPTALRAEFAKRLFLTEESQLQEALTTARVTAGNEIMMAEKEAQTAVRELERVIAEFEGKVEKEVELIEEEIEQEVQKVVPTNLWKKTNAQKLDSLSEKLQSRPLADPRPAPK